MADADWGLVGGRPCPFGGLGCSQAVLRHRTTGAEDDGYPGGPGARRCARLAAAGDCPAVQLQVASQREVLAGGAEHDRFLCGHQRTGTHLDGCAAPIGCLRRHGWAEPRASARVGAAAQEAPIRPPMPVLNPRGRGGIAARPII
ncbi:MAG: hypothetical protein EA400_01060 [Chromatiaceae bacterium]|nr:MAG: hypothetical protein EA400_01060 [Chromatiaceae bacterium]